MIDQSDFKRELKMRSERLGEELGLKLGDRVIEQLSRIAASNLSANDAPPPTVGSSRELQTALRNAEFLILYAVLLDLGPRRLKFLPPPPARLPVEPSPWSLTNAIRANHCTVWPFCKREPGASSTS